MMLLGPHDLLIFPPCPDGEPTERNPGHLCLKIWLVTFSSPASPDRLDAVLLDSGNSLRLPVYPAGP